MTNTQNKIKICNDLIEARLVDMPNNHLYHFAKKQMLFISSKLKGNERLNDDDYRNVRIGLMCAKELENIDDEFCDAVYEMKTAIRPLDYEV